MNNVEDVENVIGGLRRRVSSLEERVRVLEPEVHEAEPERVLKPCPFCLGDTNLSVHQFSTRCFTIRCSTCECEGPPRRTEKEAKLAWNERREKMSFEVRPETVECPFCRETWIKPVCTS